MLISNNDPSSLREEIVKNINQFNMDQLTALYDFVSSLASDRLTEIADEAWDDGKVDREKIEKFVKEHKKNK